jgi:hypothetical protein
MSIVTHHFTSLHFTSIQFTVSAEHPTAKHRTTTDLSSKDLVGLDHSYPFTPDLHSDDCVAPLDTRIAIHDCLCLNMHCTNNSILSLAPRSYSSSKLGRQSLCGFRIERVEVRGRKFTGWDLALE